MHIAFLNPQGNFHTDDLYLTEHPDFGGQLIYVKEVAQAVARLGLPVDIITRRIRDEKMPGFEKQIDTYKGIEGLRIIRIPFGGDSFLPKENLWPYLHDYVNGIIAFYHQEGRFPQVVTGHYGDGGLAGALFRCQTGIPFTFTIHSPGALKMEKLGLTKENFHTVNQQYSFDYRLYGERRAMEYSCINIVSTKQERFEQYGHRAYKGFVDPKDDNAFTIVSPGVNTRLFFKGEGSCEGIRAFLHGDLDPSRLHLPGIIASSRLEGKKNHQGLLTAFALRSELQEKANLLIALRGVKDPWEGKLGGTEGGILRTLLTIIKNNSLKGKVAFLDVANQEELANCYRYLSQNKGVFALTALYEPFGLAPLEAAACGLPVVVTKNGGPAESLKDGEQEYGVLVDPSSPFHIGEGLLRLLENDGEWDYFHHHGMKRVRDHYTWEETAAGYLEAIERCKVEGAGTISFPWPEKVGEEELKVLFSIQ